MIRLYREIVIQLIAVLRSLHKLIEDEPDKVRFFDLVVFEANDEKLGKDGPQTLNELVKLLEAQTHHYTNNDVDLIDLMVKTLKLPYLENRLTSRVLTKLRHVLLIPNEFNALVSELKRQELECFQCRASLMQGQLTVADIQDGRNVLYCTNCIQPRCLSAGKTTVRVSKHLLAALKKNAISEDVIQENQDIPDNYGVPFLEVPVFDIPGPPPQNQEYRYARQQWVGEDPAAIPPAIPRPDRPEPQIEPPQLINRRR